MSLIVDVQHTRDHFTLDVQLTLGGGLTALLGPSGAGKTTTLDVIAGLLRPDKGSVSFNGDVLTDTGRNISIPPHARHIGYVFQDARLFPHLTVKRNLAFGDWFRSTRSGSVAGGLAISLTDIVSLLDLETLLPRRPSTLSGGERRRVALGRALLSRPRLLLLDEPLGSVDVARRQEILPYLYRMINELRIPMIYVTHDWDEIQGRAEQIVRLERGRVIEGLRA